MAVYPAYYCYDTVDDKYVWVIADLNLNPVSVTEEGDWYNHPVCGWLQKSVDELWSTLPGSWAANGYASYTKSTEYLPYELVETECPGCGDPPCHSSGTNTTHHHKSFVGEKVSFISLAVAISKITVTPFCVGSSLWYHGWTGSNIYTLEMTGTFLCPSVSGSTSTHFFPYISTGEAINYSKNKHSLFYFEGTPGTWQIIPKPIDTEGQDSWGGNCMEYEPRNEQKVVKGHWLLNGVDEILTEGLADQTWEHYRQECGGNSIDKGYYQFSGYEHDVWQNEFYFKDYVETGETDAFLGVYYEITVDEYYHWWSETNPWFQEFIGPTYNTHPTSCVYCFNDHNGTLKTKSYPCETDYSHYIGESLWGQRYQSEGYLVLLKSISSYPPADPIDDNPDTLPDPGGDPQEITFRWETYKAIRSDESLLK
jgi:hypothetical protein